MFKLNWTQFLALCSSLWISTRNVFASALKKKSLTCSRLPTSDLFSLLKLLFHPPFYPVQCCVTEGFNTAFVLCYHGYTFELWFLIYNVCLYSILVCKTKVLSRVWVTQTHTHKCTLCFFFLYFCTQYYHTHTIFQKTLNLTYVNSWISPFYSTIHFYRNVIQFLCVNKVTGLTI